MTLDQIVQAANALYPIILVGALIWAHLTLSPGIKEKRQADWMNALVFYAEKWLTSADGTAKADAVSDLFLEKFPGTSASDVTVLREAAVQILKGSQPTPLTVGSREPTADDLAAQIAVLERIGKAMTARADASPTGVAPAAPGVVG